MSASSRSAFCDAASVLANTGIQTIVNNDYPTTVKANDLIDSFQEFVNTQQLMLLDEAGVFRQKSEKHLAEISAHITALLADLNKSSTDAASQCPAAAIF